MKHGKTDDIIHRSFHLGTLLMEAHIVIPHGAAFDTGMRQHKTLADARNSVNRRRRTQARSDHALWIEAAREIWEKSPRYTASECADLVIRRLGIKPSKRTGRKRTRTVRRVIAVADPKKVGHAG